MTKIVLFTVKLQNDRRIFNGLVWPPETGGNTYAHAWINYASISAKQWHGSTMLSITVGRYRRSRCGRLCWHQLRPSLRRGLHETTQYQGRSWSYAVPAWRCSRRRCDQTPDNRHTASAINHVGHSRPGSVGYGSAGQMGYLLRLVKWVMVRCTLTHDQVRDSCVWNTVSRLTRRCKVSPACIFSTPTI